MRCLYCGKRIALLRKLTDGEFCTDEHRRLYQQEQEKMALARLVDAQKRFSGFNGDGHLSENLNGTAPSGAALNGTSAAVPPASGQISEGFLRDLPLRAYAPVPRRILPAQLSQLPEMFLPELNLGKNCSPAFTDRMTLPDSAARQIEFPMRTGDPRPELSSPTPSIPAGSGYSAEAPSIASLQPAVALREAVGIAPAENRIAVALCPAEPFGERLLPVLVDYRMPDVPRGASVEVKCPAQASRVQRLETPVAPAPFCATPPASLVRVSLAVLPDAPVQSPVNEEEQMDSDCPPVLRKLFPLPKPALRTSNPSLRRSRAREVFFPVSKAGYLQALASKAAKRCDGPGVHSGTDGAQWKPGSVPNVFQFSPKDDTRGVGVQSFPFVSVESGRMTSLPVLVRVDATEPGLAYAERLDAISLFLAKNRSLTALPSVDPCPEPSQVSSTSPCCRFAAYEPGLCWLTDLLPAAEIAPATGARKWVALKGEPIDPARKDPALPLHSFSISAIAAELSIRTSMVVIEPAGERPSALGMISSETGFVSENKKVEASFPASRIHSRSTPVTANTVYGLTPGEGSPYPKNTVAIQELSAVWPEPVPTTPMLTTGIIEDSDVREAVKAMSAILEHERGRGFLSRLPLPQLAFTRPDLKWFVMSIPVVLLFAVYSLTSQSSNPQVAAGSLPPAVEIPAPAEPVETPAQKPSAPETAPVQSAPLAAPAASAPVQVVNAGNTKAGFMDNLRQGIMQRAAVSLSDDFRSGLGEWEGRGDWSKSWSYDPAGFVHTGLLALYKPSIPLTDYSMEFLGQIEKKSMGWVYRASDLDNYYASKIVLVKSGPMPVAAIERYAVVNGKVSSMARRPMPVQVRTDMLYRIRMDVRGDGFTLTVQGQVVDYWSDNRLKTGGVGFFSAKGEQSSLRWVEISHQYDFLGRLCAFLAPYSIPTKDGSVK